MKNRQSADIVFLSAVLIVLAVAPFGVLLFSNTMDSPPSPVIESVYPEGDPIQPFLTDGDLWLNTWADDGNVYSGWGDGIGVALHADRTDCGIAKFSGSFPTITAEERCVNAPTSVPDVNDKPSSLLYFNKRLYGHFHSPLGDAWIGFLAFSDDYGKTWARVGFFQEKEIQPVNASPWTRDKNSKFRCAFFINMGKNFEWNTDGYVYALGIGKEWAWFGGVYLMRVKKEDILKYTAWEYYSGIENNKPQWSASQSEAAPVDNVRTMEQGSALYHPGVKRYLFLTKTELYDAPNPWGPWTSSGSWTDQNSPIQWQGGYQPGIIGKDTGPDSFWFTIAGQNQAPKITYRLHLGKMRMKLRVVKVHDREESPEKMHWIQNYPNPCNPTTTIAYVLTKPSASRLILFDIQGQMVRTLVNPYQHPGRHSIVWNGCDDQGHPVPTGVYFIQFSTPELLDQKKMLLIR